MRIERQEVRPPEGYFLLNKTATEAEYRQLWEEIKYEIVGQYGISAHDLIAFELRPGSLGQSLISCNRFTTDYGIIRTCTSKALKKMVYYTQQS